MHIKKNKDSGAGTDGGVTPWTEARITQLEKKMETIEAKLDRILEFCKNA